MNVTCGPIMVVNQSIVIKFWPIILVANQKFNVGFQCCFRDAHHLTTCLQEHSHFHIIVPKLHPKNDIKIILMLLLLFLPNICHSSSSLSLSYCSSCLMHFGCYFWTILLYGILFLCYVLCGTFSIPFSTWY